MEQSQDESEASLPKAERGFKVADRDKQLRARAEKARKEGHHPDCPCRDSEVCNKYLHILNAYEISSLIKTY